MRENKFLILDWPNRRMNANNDTQKMKECGSKKVASNA